MLIGNNLLHSRLIDKRKDRKFTSSVISSAPAINYSLLLLVVKSWHRYELVAINDPSNWVAKQIKWFYYPFCKINTDILFWYVLLLPLLLMWNIKPMLLLKLDICIMHFSFISHVNLMLPMYICDKIILF